MAPKPQKLRRKRGRRKTRPTGARQTAIRVQREPTKQADSVNHHAKIAKLGELVKQSGPRTAAILTAIISDLSELNVMRNRLAVISD